MLDDSAQIYFGVIIHGSGRVWVDDVTLETTGQVRVDAPEPARPLSDTGLANLVAFAKVFGYARHFNPSDQVAAADWETIAAEGARLAEEAVNRQELAERIQSVFNPIAPTIRIYPEGSRPELPAELRPASRNGLRVVRWRHYGVRIGADSPSYQSTREWAVLSGGQLPAGWIDPAEPFDAAIGSGLRVQVPLTLYGEDYGTRPWGPLPSSDDLYIRGATNRGTRLAAVIIAWNAIQHFYPYFDVIDVDWHAELAKALKAAAADATVQDFQKTLRRFWASLKDGHGSVSAVEGFPAVPLVWDWVENQLVVTRVKQDQQSGIQRGDRVVSIDGKSAEAAIAEIEALTSGATPQWIRWRAQAELAYCTASTRRMRLEIEPFAQPGTRRSIELACGTDYDWSEPRPEMVAELEPGIFYIDIGRITDADWRAALPSLTLARGIVFDLRGYPRTSSYLNHFAADGVIDSAQWHIPTPEKPDRADLSFYHPPGWNLKPVEPYLRAKKVFLTDGRAISFAESVMGIVEAYKFADIVGSATAGTNGNVNTFSVPGGFRLVFTGMKVLKHDGSRHHGVGIAPTIPLPRTRAGVAAGRDEVLLRGIEAAKQP
ncbi:MAG: hypothetical protein HY822_20785 [Acidobacteria bacterium]|nr:hypothetical protein [Acidobacteriota bacterium]